jgi:uncharacterized protein
LSLSKITAEKGNPGQGSSKYVIAGGTGFIGQALSSVLVENGNQVVILSRSLPQSGNPQLVHWDGETVGDWSRELEGAHALINLAGRTVNARHTPPVRKEILESRVRSVAALRQALEKASNPPRIWLQASAIGFYGDRGEESLNESSGPEHGLLSDVTAEWEKEFGKVQVPRKVTARLGVVLGREGGAFPTLEKIVKGFAGGSARSGKQFVSWIHVQDVVRAILFLVEQGDGVYNLTSPNPVTNRIFMAELRKAFHRPWSPPAPAWALKLAGIFMDMQPELILESTRCYPRRLKESGFEFRFPDIGGALGDLAGSIAHSD